MNYYSDLRNKTVETEQIRKQSHLSKKLNLLDSTLPDVSSNTKKIVSARLHSALKTVIKLL